MDEVSKILQGLHNLAGKKDKKQVYEVFFALLATIVGLGISAKHVDEKTMNKDYAIAALDVMRNFHTKGTTITGIFARTPGNTWPDGFQEFLTARSNETPTTKWCADNNVANLPPDVHKLCFYGSKLLTCYKDTKQFINNTPNPAWGLLPKIIPSGVLKSSLYNWVRKSVWPTEATELAKASVRQKVARQMKSTGSTAKFNMSDHTEELATDIASRTFKDTWFPQCWLCFIYYGLPSNDPRPCFISGSVALAKTTETLTAIRDIGAFSRDTRRKIDSVVDSLETPKRQKISSPVESGVVKQVQVNFGSITNVMDKVTAAKMRWELHSSGKPLSVIK